MKVELHNGKLIKCPLYWEGEVPLQVFSRKPIITNVVFRGDYAEVITDGEYQVEVITDFGGQIHLS